MGPLTHFEIYAIYLNLDCINFIVACQREIFFDFCNFKWLCLIIIISWTVSLNLINSQLQTFGQHEFVFKILSSFVAHGWKDVYKRRVIPQLFTKQHKLCYSNAYPFLENFYNAYSMVSVRNWDLSLLITIYFHDIFMEFIYTSQ